MKKFTFNDTVKIIISIDCATTLCNTEFKPVEAIAITGIKKKEYARQKELIEKLLNLGKKFTLDEICAQLEINDATKNDAYWLLNEHKKRNTLLNDIDNTQYLTMAIYQSCKMRNFKSNSIKMKLMQYSRLNGKKWKLLEEDWDNLIKGNSSLSNRMKAKTIGLNGKIEEKRKFKYYCILFMEI